MCVYVYIYIFFLIYIYLYIYICMKSMFFKHKTTSYELIILLNILFF